MKVSMDDSHVQQQVFQVLMQAMARPGTWGDLPVGAQPLDLVLTALCDPAAGFADAENRVGERTRLHIGTQVLSEDTAFFVVADGSSAQAAERQHPCLGTLEDPHLSTTFVLMLPEATAENVLKLQGPGIHPSGVSMDVGGLHSRWLERRETWVRHFPMGVDFILLRGARVAALPRTTRVLTEEGI